VREEILAPIAGKILHIHVKEGDKVKEDDYLITLEALKMENPVISNGNGTVSEIRIKKDEEVEADALLMVIDYN
jgi:biotin carboxyl carrier protein